MDIRFFVNSILLGAGLAMDAFSISCANALREPRMRLPRMSLIAGVYGVFQFTMPILGWICVHTIEERFEVFQPFIPWIALALLVWIGGKMLIEGIRESRSESRRQDKRNVPESNRQDTPNLQKPDRMNMYKSGQSQERSTEDLSHSSADMKAAGTETASVETVGAEEVAGNRKSQPALTIPVLLLQGIATSIDALSVGFTIAGYDLKMAISSCLIIGVVTFAICMTGLAIGKKAGMKLASKAGILGGVILIAIGLEIVITSYI